MRFDGPIAPSVQSIRAEFLHVVAILACFASNQPDEGDTSHRVVSHPLCAGADRSRARRRDWLLLSRAWTIAEAARHRLYQPRQDDHRADHLLHRRAWHRLDVRFEETW